MFHPAYHLLLSSIQQYISIDEKSFIEAQHQQPYISVKVNPDKIKDTKDLNIELSENVLWGRDAYYLKNRPAFYLDPLFYAGTYYVMDASSMFLEYILNQLNISKNSVILDIAAAPGGKSVIISNYLNEDGLLWSNEINLQRSKVLHYNLSKWGKSNFIITNNDSKNFSQITNTFDVVVCDAPCTGSGLFRKYPEWINSFNENLIQQCVYRQKQILKNIFPCIKENAYLIYSTCSFCSEEDEDISKYIIQNGFEYVDITIPQNFGIIKSPLGIRFFPHLTKSEGFFYAVFQKKENNNLNSVSKRNLYIKTITSSPFDEYLDLQDFHKIYLWNNKYYLSNKISCEYLYPSFKYISLGSTISDLKSYLPAPELALSIHLSDKVPKINLSFNEAIQYLKKESVQISAQKSIYLVTHKNTGLGWIKVLENRINNYFPTEWRILND